MYRIDDEEAVELDPMEVKPQPTKHPSTVDNSLGSSNGTSKHAEPQKSQKTVTVDEVEDEALIAQRTKPKSPKHLLVPMEEEDDDQEELKGESPSTPSEPKEVHLTSTTNSDGNQQPSGPLPPPPIDTKPTCLHKKRQTEPGLSTLGISVLSAKGWVASLDNERIDLRLDSCTSTYHLYHKP